MRARDAILVVACLGACLALASCASSSTPGQAGGSPEHGDEEYGYAGYQQLIKTELGPLVTRLLSEDPWLKERPFIIAPFVDGERQELVDDLSRAFRRDLEDAILSDSRVELRRLHVVSRPQQPHRVAELGCDRRGTDFEMLLGLELRQTDDYEMTAILKAVDLESGQYLPLSLRRHFRASVAELELHRRRSPDETLLGTRQVPFARGSKDDVARFLAFNLSCVSHLGSSRVFIDSSGLESDFDLDTVRLMIAYLQSYNALEIAHHPSTEPEVLTLTVQAFDDAGVRLITVTGPHRTSARAYYRLADEPPDLSPPARVASYPVEENAIEGEGRTDGSATGDRPAVDVWSTAPQTTSQEDPWPDSLLRRCGVVPPPAVGVVPCRTEDVAYDAATGLLWSLVWSRATTTKADAESLAQRYAGLGSAGWRLPGVREILSLPTHSRDRLGLSSSRYWTADQVGRGPEVQELVVSVHDRTVLRIPPSGNAAVLLVRDIEGPHR